MPNQKAGPGEIFVCLACGKTSSWKYGFADDSQPEKEKEERVASRGWDESCMLNSVLVREVDLTRNEHGRVIKIREDATILG